MSTSEKIDLSALKIHRGADTEKRSASKNKKILLYAIGIIFLTLLMVFARAIFTSEPLVEVTTVTLQYPSQANQILVASGYVVAQRKAAVASKATGRLVELRVVEGDQVKKNDIIARIETSDIEATILQAKANVDVGRAEVSKAQAELHDASRNYNRSTSLFGEKTISQSEFDIAEARFRRATATVQSAEAGVKSYEAVLRAAYVQFENTLIRAPFDGTVLTKNADIGEVVAPFGASANSRGAVVTMADMNSLEVEADVSESNIERIHTDQPCEITLDAFPDKRYRGVVGKIVPTADRAKATVMTKVRFVDKDNRVLPEMSAKVSFLSQAISDSAASQKPKLVVNIAAVVSKDGSKAVYVIKDNIIRIREVTLGAVNGSTVEVLSGLSVGEKVVLKPAENLSDGMKVKTVKD